MYAQVGDRIIVGGDPARTGLIIGTPHADGSPPYVVKWLSGGHIAMISPGQFARIVRGHRDGGRSDLIPLVGDHQDLGPGAGLGSRHYRERTG